VSATASTPLLRRGRLVIRVGDAVALRVGRRPLVVGALLTTVLVALFVVSLGTGDFPISPREVVTALAGHGDEGTRFIVADLRLPRAVCAILVGIALAISGAVFQALTRNPLGSPDIVGFSQGASVGALIVITVLQGSGAAISLGAITGGAVTALAVYLLAFRHGSTSGYRIVLIGVAISFLLVSITDYLLAKARIEEAQEATRWLLGSLNNRSWDDVLPVAVVLAVLLPAMLPAVRALRALELGDARAQSLGVRVEPARIALVALAVGLVSITTVAVGPIGFVALTAPQIARRLARSAGPPIICSALLGAVIVLASDIAAQRLVPSTPLPVGVMTGTFGGLYLAWLLTMEWRSGHR
jgi:iron complex transport system permease protein